MGSAWMRFAWSGAGFNRGLVLPDAGEGDDYSLEWHHLSNTYSVTTTEGHSRLGIPLADLPTLLNPMPTPADLAWLRGEETT